MRVLYLCFDPGIELFGPAGGSIHIRSMVHAFAELGHEVMVVATASGSGARTLPAEIRMSPISPANRFLGRLIQRANAVMGRRVREHPDAVRILHNGTYLRTVAGAVREFRPDVVYERYSMWGVAGAWLSRFYKIPLIMEVNAPLVYEQQRFRGLTMPRMARKVEHATWRAAGRIAVVSSALLPHVERAGVCRDRIVTVPNAVDGTFFAVPVEDIRVRYGLENKFVVGFAGTFKAWHGVETLLRAFARFRAENSGHLLLVGDGPLRSSLEERAAGLGIQNDVTFAGAAEHSLMPSYLRAMDVAVAPYPPLAEFYFSPLKLFEYLASGIAVVASKAGQIADVIEDGTNGLLYEAGNEDDLLRCLRQVAGSAELRARLGRNAAASVRNCTWKRNVQLVLQPFELGANPSPGIPTQQARLV